MKKINLIFILSLLFHFVLKAQTENENDSLFIKKSMSSEEEFRPYLPPSIQPAPNAASLGTYADIPVGHYTGVPTISIPLYEIELDGKTFPITLSYHASGIKVSQEASWVGLGWILNAGGCIIKDVKGFDDFNQTYPYQCQGFYYEKDFPTLINDWNEVGINYNTSPEVEEKEKDIYRRYMGISFDPPLDPEPDLFRYNFFDYTGTMFFAKCTDEKEKSPKAILKNSVDYMEARYNKDDKIKTWVIYDGDGYSYYFGTQEITDSYIWHYKVNDLVTSVPVTSTSISAWQLDSIVSPYGNKIGFQYNFENLKSIVSREQRLFLAAHSNVYKDNFENNIYSQSKTKQALLKKITFDGGEILFSTSEREDIACTDQNKKAQKLELIEIKNYSGELIKDIQFNYKYDQTPVNPLNSRLLLESIHEYARTSNPQKHQFSYNTGKLPKKDSMESDFWGYYNGKQVKNYLSPALPLNKLANWRNHSPAYYISQSKNPSPDDTRMKYGILTTIQYPTGGKTIFTYEPHQFNNTFSSSVTLKNNLLEVGIGPVNRENSEQISGIFNLTQGNGKDNALLIERDFFLTVTYGWHMDTQPEQITTWLYLEKLVNNQFQSILSIPITTSSDQEYSQEDKGFYKLEAGQYRLRMKKFDSHDKKCEFYATLNCHEPNYYSKGGGLRIKKMTDYDTDKVITETEYKYEKEGSSSGILMSTPKYHFETPTDFWVETEWFPLPFEEFFMCSFSNSYCDLFTNGYTIGYSHVEEILKGNTDSFKTTYEFHNRKDEFYCPSGVVPHYPNETYALNGCLYKENHYDQDNRIVKEEIHYYKTKREKQVKAVKTYTHPNDEILNKNWKKILFYDLYTDLVQLEETHTQEYFYDNGSRQTIKTETLYEYNDKNFMQSKKTVINGQNINESKIIKYPVDFTDPVSKGMTAKHMVNTPIEVLTLKDDKIIDGQKMKYKDTLGIYVPRYFYSMDLTTPISTNGYSHYFKLEKSFHNYNSKGRVGEIISRDNISTVYVWSYKSLYPIGEIKNSTYEEVKNNLGIDPETLSKQSTPTMSYVENLRENLPDAFISTHKYKPLVGITETKDPREVVTVYNYEERNWLKEVFLKENGLNVILQSFKYNFRK